MKKFIPCVVLIALCAQFAPAQTYLGTADVSASLSVPAAPATISGRQPGIASGSTVPLSYYDKQGTQIFNWQFPYNYGSFINLYLLQRFTLPNTSAFLDSVNIFIADVSSGSVLFRVRQDTLIDLTGVSFRFPKSLSTPAIDSVIVDKAQLKMNAFNTIHFNGKLVPKEFFVSVEFTFNGGQNNSVTIRGDSHQLSARNATDSRLVMLNQASGGSLQLAVLDSLLVESTSHQPIYSYLHMTAYVDTATSTVVPKFDSQPKVTAFSNVLYQYFAHAAGVPRPTYALIQGPQGMTVDGATGEVRWNPTAGDAGVHQVKIRASNANGSADQNYAVTVSTASAPKITSFPRKTAIVNEPYFYQVQATGGPEPTFTLSTGPQGMVIDPTTGVITMTPTPSQGGNIYIVGVVASNPLGNDTQSFSLRVDNTASAPSIVSTAKTTGKVGEDYSYQVEANGNPQPTFSLTKAPSGMAIDNNSGLITWHNPPEGTYDVTVHAENRVGTDDQSFSLVISVGSSLPVFQSTPVTDATADQQYSYTALASGSPTPKYFLTVSSGGMTLDSLTGIMRWLPTRQQRGSHPVTIEARNDAGTVSQSFFIHVRATPRITSTPIFTAKVGVTYLYQAVAEAEPNAAFSLSQAPTGMDVDAQSGLVTWTPAAGQVGQHNVTLVATNEVGSDQQSFTVDVSPASGVSGTPESAGFVLSESYPNPVVAGASGEGRVTVEYVAPTAATVTLEVRDMLGRVVQTLGSTRVGAGRYTASFVLDASGAPHGAGLYFIVLRTPDVQLARPLTIVR